MITGHGMDGSVRRTDQGIHDASPAVAVGPRCSGPVGWASGEHQAEGPGVPWRLIERVPDLDELEVTDVDVFDEIDRLGCTEGEAGFAIPGMAIARRGVGLARRTFVFRGETDVSMSGAVVSVAARMHDGLGGRLMGRGPMGEPEVGRPRQDHRQDGDETSDAKGSAQPTSRTRSTGSGTGHLHCWCTIRMGDRI